MRKLTLLQKIYIGAGVGSAIFTSVIIALIVYFTTRPKEIANLKFYVNVSKLLANDMQVNEFTSEHDCVIILDQYYNKININGKEYKGNQANIGRVNISEDSKINITFPNETNTIIDVFPVNFPLYTIQGKSKVPGDIYVTTYESINGYHYIFKINSDNKISYYKKCDTKTYNFKKIITTDNKVRYAYLEVSPNTQKRLITFEETCLIIMDENYQVIYNLTYDEKLYTENHDYLYLNDNQYVLSSYEFTNVTNIPGFNSSEIETVACKLIYYENKTKVWEFITTDYPELYQISGINNNFSSNNIYRREYSHFNSIAIDPVDKNYVLSYRNLDCVLKISASTGKLMWILGGKGDQFNMSSDQKFERQHSLSYDDEGYLCLFNNREGGNTESKVLRIKYDNDKKTITDFFSYGTGAYSMYMGSFQMLNTSSLYGLVNFGGDYSLRYSFMEKHLDSPEPDLIFTYDKKQFIYKVNKFI